MLVISAGHGVNGFMLDPSIGEFVLTDPDMKVGAEVQLWVYVQKHFMVKSSIDNKYTFSDEFGNVRYSEPIAVHLQYSKL